MLERMIEPPADVWVHPAVAVGTSAIAGHGLFAMQPLDADVVVARLGGRLVDSAELARLIADADAVGEYVDSFASPNCSAATPVTGRLVCNGGSPRPGERARRVKLA